MIIIILSNLLVGTATASAVHYIMIDRCNSPGTVTVTEDTQIHGYFPTMPTMDLGPGSDKKLDEGLVNIDNKTKKINKTNYTQMGPMWVD